MLTSPTRRKRLQRTSLRQAVLLCSNICCGAVGYATPLVLLALSHSPAVPPIPEAQRTAVLWMTFGCAPSTGIDVCCLRLERPPRLAWLAAEFQATEARDLNKWTCLHHAAWAGNVSSLTTLLDHKADTTIKDRWSRPPLTWASQPLLLAWLLLSWL